MTPCSFPLLLVLLLLGACDGGQPEESSTSNDGGTSGVENSGGSPGLDGDGDGDGDGASGGTLSNTGGSMPVDITPGEEGRVPAFVAQGHLGRLVLSCDGGRSWIFDQSNDPDGTCWSGEVEIECDHDPGAGRGLTYGGGYFFATFGWGTPSTILRSADGIEWQAMLEGEASGKFGGLGYAAGTLLLAGRSARLSLDQGGSFSELFDTGMAGYNVRRAGAFGGSFVMVGDANDVVLSANAGESWSIPEALPDGCGADVQTAGGIAFGNGTLLIVGGDGTACYSRDGGTTFEQTHVGDTVRSHLVWSGASFFVYGSGVAFTSADGEVWTSTPLEPEVVLGPVEVGADGTFVAVEGGWGESVWYENQQFYRSEDGIHYEEAESYVGGHPIRDLHFGSVQPSESCPVPEVRSNE